MVDACGVAGHRVNRVGVGLPHGDATTDCDVGGNARQGVTSMQRLPVNFIGGASEFNRGR